MRHIAVIHTQPITPSGNPQVGQGLGAPGQIKDTPAATVMQTNTIPGSQGRAITLAPAHLGFGPHGQGSIGVVQFDRANFAVQTNLIIDYPHPGTNGTEVNVVVPGGGGSRMLSKAFAGGGTLNQGRPGLKTVSFYAGATANGSPGNNYGNGNPPGTLIPPFAGNAAGFNGVARFVATGNQFGGIGTGRKLGTQRVYFNIGSLNPIFGFDLPCKGTAMCAFSISTVV
jgi:hypothetical protein